MKYPLKKLNFKPILRLDKKNLQYTKLEAAKFICSPIIFGLKLNGILTNTYI